MTMNSTGQLSMGGSVTGESINIELGQTATTAITFNDTNVRTLLGVTTSGAQISMSNAYGKSNTPTASITYTTNTISPSLNVSTLSGYVAGSTVVTVTINSGIYLYSTGTANYGLAITGGTTGDTINVVNNGYIIGMGGDGSAGDPIGSVGGPALNISGIGTTSITIDNQAGYIAGGGGGARGFSSYSFAGRGGGGAGGGKGGGTGGGAGGAPGVAGTDGANVSGSGAGSSGAGGGGRIVPGTGGAGASNPVWNGFGGGSGGGGSRSNDPSVSVWVTGGGGAGWGATAGQPGSGGTVSTATGGTGGSAGAVGGNASGPKSLPAAAGGKGVNLGGKTITWTGGAASSSRVYGAVS